MRLVYLLLLVAAAGCARVGYTDRVLHRVPAPDGRVVAVCQEVPIFDGPEFDIRLERPDGTRLRNLLHMGDGGGCGELLWSPDGRLLAVLTNHVADINVLDAEWALRHPEVENRHWFHRGFSFSSGRQIRYASRLKFVSPEELEFELCAYSIAETQRRRGEIRCSEAAHAKRLRIPWPLVAGRPG